MAVTEPKYNRHYNDEEEQAWREDEKQLVVFFGMLGYEVVAVCDTEDEANEVLALWQMAATFASLSNNSPEQRAKHNYGHGLHMKGWTRHAYPHDFQVRTQASLDALTDAILSSNRA